MGSLSNARVAIVHEWPVVYAGSEQVVAAMTRPPESDPVTMRVQKPTKDTTRRSLHRKETLARANRPKASRGGRRNLMAWLSALPARMDN
jgi:hypothetical protein